MNTSPAIATPPATLTLVSPLVPRSVIKLQIYLPVLPGLGPVLAVAGCFVCFVIYFSAESVGKLLCTAPSLFTKEMLLAEVFTKVFVITAGRREAELQFSTRISPMLYDYPSLHLSTLNINTKEEDFKT